MSSIRLILGAVLVTFAAGAYAAGKPAVHKAIAKRPSGKQEVLACRLGTEDRHARIAVVTIGGKVDSFAYYSKWKPRTCSIYLQRRGDMYSKWSDNGQITTVDVEKGSFLVEHRKNEYQFVFRNVDRERYCGMDGMINGTLTVRKGSESCELGGDIMVEGTPLGEAFAKRDEEKAPPTLLPVTTQEVAKATKDVSPSIAVPAAAAAPAAATAAAAANTTTASATGPSE